METICSINDRKLRDRILSEKVEILHVDGFREMTAVYFEKIESPHLAAWTLLNLAGIHEKDQTAKFINRDTFAVPKLPQRSIFEKQPFDFDQYSYHLLYSPISFLNINKTNAILSDYLNCEFFSEARFNHNSAKLYPLEKTTIETMLKTALAKISHSQAAAELTPYEMVSTLAAIGLMMRVHLDENQAEKCYRMALDVAKTEAAKLATDDAPKIGPSSELRLPSSLKNSTTTRPPLKHLRSAFSAAEKIP